VAWSLLTEWDSSTVNDAGAFTTTGTGIGADGTGTLVMAGDTTVIDGFQENWAGWTRQLIDLYPDWSDATDRLDLYLEIAHMDIEADKYGFLCGVIDREYASRASANATAFNVYPNAITVYQISQSAGLNNGAAANTGSNTDRLYGVYASITWDAFGVGRISLRPNKHLGAAEATIVGTPQTAHATLAGRRIFVGHSHVAASAANRLLAFRLWHRRLRGAQTHSAPAGPKQTLPRVILVMGDSIANGVGQADPNAGAALPAGLTFIDGGSVVTTWPSNAGTGPDPGYLPYLVDPILDAGATSLTVIRRATNGRILADLEVVELPASTLDCAARGIDRSTVDLVVLSIGENDAQNTTESAAYTARIDQTLELIQLAYPNARIVLNDMVSEDLVGYGQFATIRSANAAAVALRATWDLLPPGGITLQDAVHYNVAGCEVAGAGQWTTYQAMP
jgi:lysophospholipase L1-like esterase